MLPLETPWPGACTLETCALHELPCRSLRQELSIPHLGISETKVSTNGSYFLPKQETPSIPTWINESGMHLQTLPSCKWHKAKKNDEAKANMITRSQINCWWKPTHKLGIPPLPTCAHIDHVKLTDIGLTKCLCLQAERHPKTVFSCPSSPLKQLNWTSKGNDIRHRCKWYNAWGCGYMAFQWSS